MINLLPPQIKSDIIYARKNTVILKWLIVIIIVVLGIFVVIIFGQLYINQSKKTYNSQIEQKRDRLKIQKLAETQSKVQSISSSIKLSTDVLSEQILFSKVINQIGKAIPEGSVLTGLSITKLEGGIDLTAAAIDYNTATQVQLNLQDPNNKIFDKADIVSTQCKDSSTPSANQLEALYPCNITIRALFAKNNSFSLINKESDKK